MNIHESNQSEIAWSSWFAPFLACWSASAEKSVIEVGIGHFSTPAIHALVIPTGYPVISLEANPIWLGVFEKLYSIPNVHCFDGRPYNESVEAWSKDMRIRDMKFGVGLIDESPGGERRLHSFEWLIDVCNYVVVHDYHRENRDCIHSKLDGLNWRVCDTYQPPTLVASKTCKIPVSIV